MAIVGGLVAKAPIGQLCAARHHIRAAGLRPITQAALNRSQSTSSIPYVGQSKMLVWEGTYYVTHLGWCRDSLSGYPRGYATKAPGLFGCLRRYGLFQMTGASKPSESSSVDFDEEMRGDARRRDHELEAESGSKEKENHALSVVGGEVSKGADEVAKDGSTETSAVAENALDKVGDIIKGTGLELELQVELKELTIKELVLRDLGLVLVVKTKPQSD